MNRNDFVVSVRQLGVIVKNSVGIIHSIDKNDINVYFIGKGKNVNVESSDITVIDVSKTGKGYSKKICNICYVLKDYFEDFEINQTDAKGQKTTRPSCNECRTHIDGVKLLSSEKKRMLSIKPKGLFECPICHKKSIAFITGNIVIDHDHSNGKAREWICDSCNTGLGRFKDSIEVMQNAIEYLQKYNNTKSE